MEQVNVCVMEVIFFSRLLLTYYFTHFLLAITSRIFQGDAKSCGYIIFMSVNYENVWKRRKELGEIFNERRELPLCSINP